MAETKAHILAQLKKDILLLEGFQRTIVNEKKQSWDILIRLSQMVFFHFLPCMNSFVLTRKRPVLFSFYCSHAFFPFSKRQYCCLD